MDSAAAAITRETVGDISLSLPAAPVAQNPTDGHGDDSGGGGGGTGGGVAGGLGHGGNMLARHRQACLESKLTRLGGEVSRQLESVAAGEQTLNDPRLGGGIVRLQEEARSLRDEETAVLAESAERQDRVAALAEELCEAENAVEEVGSRDENRW